MPQKSRIVGCEVLHEFIDDASARPTNGEPPARWSGPETLRMLIARIAREVGLREINFEPVVNELVVQMGPELEERVRKVLLKMIEDDRKTSEDSSAA